jgi:plastocyanin
VRRAVLALAGLLLLVTLAPAVLASSPAGPTPAAGDPTAIDAVTPSALVAGIESTLVATLRDTATSTPVGGANLSFSEQTTFGWLLLGNATTNAQGEAGVTYEPAYNGTYTVVIAYAGDGSYAPTNTTLTLTVFAASAPPAPPIPADRLIVFVILAVVGCVWATYAFVAWQILGIRSVGSRPEDEAFESRELEKMEKEPEDAGASKKRAPGIANTNRAVVYLAISALILSGAAVALLVTGGVGHTAAYIPSTVSLQVTVIPDFRGAGWDSFVPDELVVHAGDTVKVTVYNEDTMDHGFAIDAFGVNQVLPAASQDNTTGDITPSITLVTFTATAAGAFLWYCTNPCGPGHTTMTGTLVILPDD